MRASFVPCLFLAILSSPVLAQVQQRGTPAPARTAVAAERVQGAAAKTEVLPSWWRNMISDPERQDLPLVHEERQLGMGTTDVTVAIVEPEWEVLTPTQLLALPGLGRPGPDAVVHSSLGISRKRPYALVDIEPYRTNPATGQVERLKNYRLSINEVQGAQRRDARGTTYPDHSKLASGEWYRFTVAKEGVYSLTYEFLQQLGVDVAGLNSDQVNVYGNQAGVLPYTNLPFLPTDLELNAVLMEDGGDGVFGPGDRILFYAKDAQRWVMNADGLTFNHVKNAWTDSASYFIGIGTDGPKRITTAVQTTDPATDEVTSFTDRQVIDKDGVNVIKSGRIMFSELYDQVTSYNYNFPLPNSTNDSVNVRMAVLGRSLGSSSSFKAQAGGVDRLVSISPTGTDPGADFGKYVVTAWKTGAVSGALPITVSYIKNNPVTALGYMDYLEVNARRNLQMNGDQMAFRDPRSVGAGRVAHYVLTGGSTVQHVWEVTDPLNVREVTTASNNGTLDFTMATDSLREFVAVKGSGLLVPVAIGPVAAQDLHGTVLPTDLVIVCPPQFLGEAGRLAQRRTDEGLTVAVVTPQQVFNEFSSGQRDGTAIKRYMKMLYDRAGNDPSLSPRYLLMFGDGSYNNFSLDPSNQNLVPSYESFNSWGLANSFTSDDYFVTLDDNEGESPTDLVDMGVGRFPVSTLAQAQELVNKLLNYDKLELSSAGVAATCTVGGDGGAADWRTSVLFCSDDRDGDTNGDGTIHMANSEQLANRVDTAEPYLNINKVYLDAYQQYSTPGGQRYPDASRELQERVQKGTLLVNYVGHGGEVGWAHERFLDNSTILGWTNDFRLPLFMTATCEFSRWDDPARTSAGEYVLLNPNGGGIGLFTTTRIAYVSSNQIISNDFYDYVFLPTDEQGREQRIGDVYRRTKVAATPGGNSTSVNHRNFSLLGDPSMRLALPRNSAAITAITDTLGSPMDTIKALAVVRITGTVNGPGGTVLTDFNGTVVPTVYDKVSNVQTLQNDPGGLPFSFPLRRNIIYKGRATVTNGTYSFTFVVPKDIDYAVGAGRISIYAESATTNAVGYTNDPLVGSTDPNAALDVTGPTVELYLNDESFVPGGITNTTPLLYAKLFDQSGINTLGSSIGHDLSAVIDANTENAIVLNDWYEAEKDSYQKGQVRYKLSDLPEGRHTLDLKAWDVYNNSTIRSTEFIVAPSSELALAHVLNYPNPFTTHTDFYFEHNRPCETLDAQVQVFTVTGRLVKTINRRLTCNGFRSEPLPWDGLDDEGDKIGRGVYIYRLSITTATGEKADKLEKLVILR
ncbi:MAG: type IX secretion system sortase PorU [Flavobacteriales bacterium]|nr:type IX secretion system sortase PorU [Flavobacteriales bacterium]